jgi:bifunctional non-homologous end joining protein LigD
MTITHPEKILFPDQGITKRELAAYYDAVAAVMLPHVRGRPVTMERFPNGIGADGFLQKNVVRGMPAWLKRVETPKQDGGTVHYPLAADARSLQWMANQNTVTLHVWASRVPRLERPDVCVLDLDPPGDDGEALRTVALALRDLLAARDLPSFVKTSGSKGLHVVVPLGSRATYAQSARLADEVAAELVGRHPQLATQAFSKAERGGRLYVDTGRNRAGATFAAAYTVRARPGAPVSAPCTWDEVAGGAVGPRTFTLRTMAARLAAVGDLWADLAPKRRTASPRQN